MGRFSAGAAVVGLILCSSQVGLAQSTSISGLLTTSAGVSDNVNLAPENPANGQEPAVSDGFTTIAPALVLTHDRRRSVHQLNYRFNALLYFENDEANSYSNELEYVSLLLLSRRSRLGFTIAASQGRTNNFQIVAPGQAVDATQDGGIDFFNITAGQNYTYEVNRKWRFAENLGFRTFIPIAGGNTDSFDVNLLVSGERLYLRNSFGLQFRNEYFAAIADGGDHQLLTGPTAFWRRDFLESWNFELGLGVIAVTSPDNFDDSGITVEPAGFAAVRFRKQRSQIEASYTHDAQPNLQVGDVFINDSANLAMSYVLIREPQVVLSANGGGQRAREVSIMDNSIGSSSFIYLADAAISWAVTPNIEVALRYQYRKQDADPGSDLESFVSNTGLFSILGRYPGAEPRRVSSLRRSFRVDGSDTADPFGGSDRREGLKNPTSIRR